MKKGKRIYDLSTLQIGKIYFVKISIWSGDFLFCGSDPFNKKRIMFTSGRSVADADKSFNLVGSKSNFKVYEIA